MPDEILGVVRQLKDEGLIDQESSGYVRTEDIGMFDSVLFCGPKADDWTVDIASGPRDKETVIPEQGDLHESHKGTGV